MVDFAFGILGGEFFEVVRDVLERGNALESFRGGPWFDTGAAPVGSNQANGNIQLLLDSKGEIVTHRGKIPHCLGSTGFPTGSVHIILGLVLGVVRDFDVANSGVISQSDFGRGVIGDVDGPFHIRLARAEPNFAHEYIVKLDGGCALGGKGKGLAHFASR